MELVFQEKQLDYLGRVLDQTVTQELTAEVIVPDSCADADRVVDAFGTLLVRAEECTAGSASVSGEVQAGILFVTEDGRLERLETVIPFSARRGWEGEQSDCRLQCVCRLCSVDARLVHSRKLLVRVGVSCTLTVYAAFTRTLHDFPEPAPTLQLRRKRLPLRLPRGLGEKSFSLNEEIEIPESKPPVERLLKCVYALDTAERKTIGNKAVFKGRLTVHILYESPDGSLQRQETELPFSQFAELEQTKLEIAAAENLTALEDCMPKEQTLIMRMKGLEQERARWMTQNGKEGLTFRALLEQCDEAQRKELQPLYDQLSRALLTLEDISKSVQQIIRTNLYVVNRKLEQQGQGYHKDGSAETAAEGHLTDSKA